MSSLVIADGVPFLPDIAPDPARDRAAIGIREGTIVAIGDLADVRDAVGPGVEEIDAAGGLVTPGFVDAHVHLGVGAVDALRCDLAGAASLDEIDARIRRFASAHPGDWVVGGGWDPTLFPGDGPRAAHLDVLVGDRPALLLDADHHAAWASSAALALAGIDARTADPSDGRIERDVAGTPTGTLRDGAVQAVARLLPEPPTEDIARGILRLSRQLLAAGITGWQEAALGAYGGFPDFSDAYLHLLRSGDLAGRATGALWVPRDLTEDGVDAFVADTVARAAELTAAGLPSGTAKLMLDGIVETRTAHLLEPYCGFDDRGRSYFPAELATRLVAALNAAGIAVHVHAIGDAAVRDALDAFAAVPDAVRRAVRNHIAHIQLIDADDVPRFAALGVTANAQPFWACATALARQSTLPLIGPERRHELYVFGSLARSGAALAMGSDWPVSTFDPWQGIHVAVTRRPPGEPDAEPLGPEESLPLRDAIDAYTRGSATLLGVGTGLLRVGERADLAVADRDPFAGPAEALHETRTAMTVLEGAVIAS
ncbi:amidohydrolase [Microbacterium sp. Bi128]|uniref:amidohydrolase n=1 Tax=Microbacterium sp. Bi128 TaxID=2821115 RepID=UPI001D41EC29|nr:amidohydrolase [Microbacterium sp. Bi128]CAH0180878.1 N-substituted formamide deformylase [Microbacterium sp. Bi128]